MAVKAIMRARAVRAVQTGTNAPPYQPDVIKEALEPVFGKGNVRAETIAGAGQNSAHSAVRIRGTNDWVPFDNRGFPDFDKWMKAEVRITAGSSRAADFRAATRQLREALGGGNTCSEYTFNSAQMRAIRSGWERIPDLLGIITSQQVECNTKLFADLGIKYGS